MEVAWGLWLGADTGPCGTFQSHHRQVVAHGPGIAITSFLVLRPKEAEEEEKATMP